jgi:hypothetical protein
MKRVGRGCAGAVPVLGIQHLDVLRPECGLTMKVENFLADTEAIMDKPQLAANGAERPQKGRILVAGNGGKRAGRRAGRDKMSTFQPALPSNWRP